MAKISKNKTPIIKVIVDDLVRGPRFVALGPPDVVLPCIEELGGHVEAQGPRDGQKARA